MGKLKLNLDEIKVESFVVSNVNSTIGTVHGNDASEERCGETAGLCLGPSGNDAIECGGEGGGGGVASNAPNCSDIFCTASPNCPTNYQYFTCQLTCYTCASCGGTCFYTECNQWTCECQYS
jgi:hypothetical protein